MFATEHELGLPVGLLQNEEPSFAALHRHNTNMDVYIHTHAHGKNHTHLPPVAGGMNDGVTEGLFLHSHGAQARLLLVEFDLGSITHSHPVTMLRAGRACNPTDYRIPPRRALPFAI